MKTHVVYGAIGGMILLVMAAFIWDSIRFVRRERQLLDVADAEVRAQETRFVQLLATTAEAPPQLGEAIAAYKAAEDPTSRRAAFDSLVAVFQQTSRAEIDPENPLDRKFMDDIAGALNRRDRANDRYEVEYLSYQTALQCIRGRIAQWFSPLSPVEASKGEVR